MKKGGLPTLGILGSLGVLVPEQLSQGSQPRGSYLRDDGLFLK